MNTDITGTNPHGHGEVVLHRDGFKVSRLTLPVGGNLPEHTVGEDLVVVILRGKGTFYVEQEPRHVGPGDIIDLVPGEEQSVEAQTEMEIVFLQVHRQEDHSSARPLAPVV